jgi:hypothetical protein
MRVKVGLQVIECGVAIGLDFFQNLAISITEAAPEAEQGARHTTFSLANKTDNTVTMRPLTDQEMKTVLDKVRFYGTYYLLRVPLDNRNSAPRPETTQLTPHS